MLGGGAWGTALALTCARAGRAVTLWEHEPGNAESLEKKRESRFLPGVRLDDGIKVMRELGRGGARRRDAAGGAGADHARGLHGAGESLERANAADRLRERHRARHA